MSCFLINFSFAETICKSFRVDATSLPGQFRYITPSFETANLACAALVAAFPDYYPNASLYTFAVNGAGYPDDSFLDGWRPDEHGTYCFWELANKPFPLRGKPVGAYRIDITFDECSRVVINLSVQAQTPPDPRPKGTEGKDPKSSTHELIAKVTENGSPKTGVAVTFASKVEAKSGGHDHHDASRPKGDVPASGVTDANGVINITFQAPLFAGTHTVEAVCNSCSNKTATHTLDVKVPNLTQLTGGGSGSLYKLIGEDGNHGSNHWYSYAAKDALIQLLSIFKEYGWGVVGVNDSSLFWGGCFDVPGRWGECKSNHAGHRTGEEVDLSFYRPSGVSKDLRDKIYNELKKRHKIEMPTILWHLEDKPNPDPTKPPLSYAHFHVYLLGQKQFGTSKY